MFLYFFPNYSFLTEFKAKATKIKTFHNDKPPQTLRTIKQTMHETIDVVPTIRHKAITPPSYNKKEQIVHESNIPSSTVDKLPENEYIEILPEVPVKTYPKSVPEKFEAGVDNDYIDVLPDHDYIEVLPEVTAPTGANQVIQKEIVYADVVTIPSGDKNKSPAKKSPSKKEDRNDSDNDVTADYIEIIHDPKVKDDNKSESKQIDFFAPDEIEVGVIDADRRKAELEDILGEGEGIPKRNWRSSLASFYTSVEDIDFVPLPSGDNSRSFESQSAESILVGVGKNDDIGGENVFIDKIPDETSASVDELKPVEPNLDAFKVVNRYKSLESETDDNNDYEILEQPVKDGELNIFKKPRVRSKQPEIYELPQIFQKEPPPLIRRIATPTSEPSESDSDDDYVMLDKKQVSDDEEQDDEEEESNDYDELEQRETVMKVPDLPTLKEEESEVEDDEVRKPDEEIENGNPPLKTQVSTTEIVLSPRSEPVKSDRPIGVVVKTKTQNVPTPGDNILPELQVVTTSDAKLDEDKSVFKIEPEYVPAQIDPEALMKFSQEVDKTVRTDEKEVFDEVTIETTVREVRTVNMVFGGLGQVSVEDITDIQTETGLTEQTTTREKEETVMTKKQLNTSFDGFPLQTSSPNVSLLSIRPQLGPMSPGLGKSEPSTPHSPSYHRPLKSQEEYVVYPPGASAKGPVSPLDLVGQSAEKGVYIAVTAYEPENDDVLSLHEGEKLELLDDNHEDWWLVRKVFDKREGLVPGHYLREKGEYEGLVEQALSKIIERLPSTSKIIFI